MQLSLSYICDSWPQIKKTYLELDTKFDMSLHMDFMDGQFVPRLGTHPETINEALINFAGHVDVHAMIQSNSNAWDDILASNANVIYAHYESFHSEQQCADFLSRDIRLKLAFKPFHTIAQIDSICERLDVDNFLLMAYNPGIKVQNAFYDLETLTDTERYVTVDGGVTLNTLLRWQHKDNIRLVAGSKIIFNDDYKQNMKRLLNDV
jgi:pentose-5-phosphate-3-epimerase